jgi:hypothetical protein
VSGRYNYDYRSVLQPIRQQRLQIPDGLSDLAFVGDPWLRTRNRRDGADRKPILEGAGRLVGEVDCPIAVVVDAVTDLQRVMACATIAGGGTAM